MSGNGDEKFVGVAGIDGNLRNLLAVAKAEMCPGLAGISGFVNAIANGEIGAVQSFPAAEVNSVWIGERNRYRADGAGGLVVKERIPCAAEVVRLPYAAIHHADIKHAGLAGNAGNGLGASTTERANATPSERLQEIRI